MCSDNLPVSLDWSHSDDVEVRTIESSRERKSNYVFPRRLSYADRKRRIFGEEQEAENETEEWSNEWTQPASLQVNQLAQQSMMDIDEALDHDEIEVDASRGVIYCRHLQDDADDDDDDDSVDYFLN